MIEGQLPGPGSGGMAGLGVNRRLGKIKAVYDF